ncbi:MAG: LEA type 2 family protein [Magnetococcales bacterium]|nr:LEA type 2 family protein [Magnetococcales bacterium]
MKCHQGPRFKRASCPSFGNGTVLVLTILLFVLAACTTPRLSFPGKLEVALLDIKPEKISFSHQVFRVRLKVFNPGADDFPLAALQATLKVGNLEFSAIHFQKPMILKKNEGTEIDATARTALAGACKELIKFFKNDHKELPYHIRGTIRVDRPWTEDVPFDRSGNIDLPRKLEDSI